MKPSVESRGSKVEGRKLASRAPAFDPRRSTLGSSRGSALLVVLWALMILSVAIFAWASGIKHQIGLHAQANRTMEARAMAHSGLAVALHPLVTKLTSELLEEQFGADFGYRVRMVSEGGKLNVNFLLQGEDPAKVIVFKQWLEMHGLGFKEREAFVDCLLDWIDQDDLHRLNGVEDDGDYHPPNLGKLLSVDELAQVRGGDALAASPGWRDELTVDSGGPVDLGAAPVEILRLIPGLGEARIQRFIAYRAGKDGIDGTADDPPLGPAAAPGRPGRAGAPTAPSIPVFSALGLSDQQIAAVRVFATDAPDPVMRILSEGRSGKEIRQVEVVARKGGGNPLILSWKE